MSRSLLKRKIPIVSPAICGQQFQQATLEKVTALQKTDLTNSRTDHSPLEALRKAYGQLNECLHLGWDSSPIAPEPTRSPRANVGKEREKSFS